MMLKKLPYRMIGCIAAYVLCGYLLPGIAHDGFATLLFTGALAGAIAQVLRPALLQLHRLPGKYTALALGYLADVLIVLILSRFVPGFYVSNPLWALCIAAVELLLRGLPVF